jgi:DSBA-like thioredoxin domain
MEKAAASTTSVGSPPVRLPGAPPARTHGRPRLGLGWGRNSNPNLHPRCTPDADPCPSHGRLHPSIHLILPPIPGHGGGIWRRDPPFAGLGEQAVKDRLRANTEELMRRGGFGSPTMFVGGTDMFFGNDRLALVRAAVERSRKRPAAE